MLRALREVLPWDRVTLVVASGTHEASHRAVPDEHRDRPVVVHGSGSTVVDLGRTTRGTRIRLLDVVAEADLERIIAQPFEIDHYQPILFVIDSYEQLYEALTDYRRRYLH